MKFSLKSIKLVLDLRSTVCHSLEVLSWIPKLKLFAIVTKHALMYHQIKKKKKKIASFLISPWSCTTSDIIAAKNRKKNVTILSFLFYNEDLLSILFSLRFSVLEKKESLFYVFFISLLICLLFEVFQVLFALTLIIRNFQTYFVFPLPLKLQTKYYIFKIISSSGFF